MHKYTQERGRASFDHSEITQVHTHYVYTYTNTIMHTYTYTQKRGRANFDHLRTVRIRWRRVAASLTGI